MNTLPRPRERDVLAQCLKLLRVLRIFHWRVNTGAMRREKRFVRFGQPGMSDILACVGGRLICIETKRPGGKLTDEQKAFLDHVRAAGGLAFVVSDVKELERALRAEGAIP